MADTVVVRSRFEPSTERSASVVIAETLALVLETHSTAPPLAERIDTDSIDALFSPAHGPPPHADLTLTFPYEQWTVTVTGQGDVVVTTRLNHELSSD